MKNEKLWMCLLMPLLIAVMGVSFFTACSDDEDDADSNDNKDDDGLDDEAFNSCEETATILTDINQVSELVGVSGANILDESGGGSVVSAAYSDDESILTQSPLGGQTDLTIAIIYENGEIRQIESLPVDDGTGQDIAADCRHRVELDVTINVSTDDGAFNEAWQAVLAQSLSYDGVNLDDPGLAADFDPYDLAGSFEIVSIAGEPPDKVTGSFNTTAVDPYQGGIDILVEQSSGEGDEGTVSQARHVALSW